MGFVDRFDGSVLDPTAWDTHIEGGNSILVQDGRLYLVASNGSMFEPGMAGAVRNAPLFGDFTVTAYLNARITQGPALPFGWAVMGFGADGENPEFIGFFKFGALDLALAHVRVDEGFQGVGVIPIPTGIDEFAASLRVSRVGSLWTVEADIDDGSGFQQMSQVSGSSDPVTVILYALNAGNPVLAQFDDYAENAVVVEEEEYPVSAPYRFPNLGCDLLLDDEGDFGVSVTGDLALTPNGRVCLLQDIADLLETLPKDLFGHQGYGAGIGRLFGENYKPDFVSHVERTIKDALTNDPSVSPRLVPGNTRVEMQRFSDTELSVSILCEAISDGQIISLNLVWEYGIDDVSRIREVA